MTLTILCQQGFVLHLNSAKKMKPRVIWLDDDIKSDKLRATVVKFGRCFDLIECENIDDFRKKSKSCIWDAAILDVLNADASPVDIFASFDIVGKEKPWFVFSGQDSIIKQDNIVKDVLDLKEHQRNYISEDVYVKGEHEDKLIEDIENAVKNKRIWQVESQYEAVLKIAESFDDKDCRKNLLDILCAANGAYEIDSHVFYNRIRVILEWMFRKANDMRLLHDNCFDNSGKINLTDSCLFMSGRPTIHSGVICKQTHFPVLLAKNVSYILEVTGGASHTTVVDEKEMPNLTSYWANIKTPYLLYSLAFMLCDILIWFGSYIEINNDLETNQSQWRDLDLEGIIELDTKGKYYVGDCFIPNNLITLFKPGSYVQVTDYEETPQKFKSTYIVTAKKLKAK